MRSVTAVLSAVLVLGGISRAEAAPQFLLPDWNFATHGNTLCFTGPSNAPLGFTFVESAAQGDIQTVDTGSGFRVIPFGLVVNVSGGEGSLNFADGRLTASLVSFKSTPSLAGRDIFAIFRVTSSSLPFSTTRVGSLIGFDALAFNIDANGCGKAKGDWAPIVPEPSVALLIVFGVGAIVRRRFAR